MKFAIMIIEVFIYPSRFIHSHLVFSLFFYEKLMAAKTVASLLYIAKDEMTTAVKLVVAAKVDRGICFSATERQKMSMKCGQEPKRMSM